MIAIDRRAFLSSALLLPAFARQTSTERFVSVMPLGNPGGAAPPFGRLLGDGLDARLFTNLSTLAVPRTSPGAPRTSTEEFFVRTAFPRTLARTDPWTIRIGGLVRSALEVNLRDLEPLATTSGRYLLECSGNSDPSNFGLISTADWDGIPLPALLDRAAPSSASYRIAVSGVDEEGALVANLGARRELDLSPDDLQRALLATRLNGAPLPRDHGFPVRLIVPGWYGCACIKWVDHIDLVPDQAAATAQMQEFAARTHQPLLEAWGPRRRGGTRAMD